MSRKLNAAVKAVPPLPTPDAEVRAKLQQAIALHQRGCFEEAIARYSDILRINPRHFDAVHLLGVVADQTGNHQLAADLIAQAIAINPSNAEAYFNRGNALKTLGQLEAAIESYDRATALDRRHASAYNNRGIALQGLNRREEAVASYDAATRLKPEYVDAHYNRGLALQELKHLEAAVESYDKAIALNPAHADAYNNRGNALKDLKQFETAVESYHKAISLRPNDPVTYYNRGNALKGLKQFEAAVENYDKAIALKPDFAEAYNNRGLALQELKHLEAAVESYDKAIALKPDFAAAYWNKSLALLLTGDFENGWPLYEWRWKRDDFTSPRRNFRQPLWLGDAPIEGKTILLHFEQGLGDTIQFIRYAKLVAAKGAKVVVLVPKPLLGLLQCIEGVSEWIEEGEAPPAFDFHCPLLSLPLAFKTTLATIPSSEAYLRSDGDKVAAWRSRLSARTKPRVGLVWSGSTTHKNDSSRSLALASLIEALPDGFDYVSLQKEVRDSDQKALTGSGKVHHFGDELNDFTDTAALCDLMDVVISVDTSVAHLSGTLGKTTWVLLPYVPDWRWLLDRNDSPWYRSVRLYRQDSDRNWAGVLARVGTDLSRRFGVA